MTKVLLFCPTYDRDGLDQFWPDAEDSFKKVRAPEGVKVIREVGRDNPWPLTLYHRYRNTLHQYRLAQARALDEGFDALVTHESDMLVPPEGLQALWDTDAPVVYGLYVLRHGSNCVNALETISGSPNIGSSLTGKPKLYRKAEEAGQTDVSGVGFGFTLIRREALEKFPFREVDENSYSPDWMFASDCYRAGVRQICRFDVRCGHIEDTGNILWPGAQYPQVPVKVLQSFTGNAGRGVEPFRAGEFTTMDAGKVGDFARAGYVELLAALPDIQMTARPRREAKGN